jgi:rubrerythrin
MIHEASMLSRLRTRNNVDRFICIKCEVQADDDEEPAYCENCGWNGCTYEQIGDEPDQD